MSGPVTAGIFMRHRFRVELKRGDLINSKLKPVFVADPLPLAG
jgi:hypothetical protein